MATVHLSIDVPELESGVEFYTKVFGFLEKARPFNEMAVLDANNVTICVHAKSAGSTPAPQTQDVRKYSRHWTPVHADFHVEDIDAVLHLAQQHGAKVEQMFRPSGRKAVAFCSDPFGNGFCVIESS